MILKKVKNEVGATAIEYGILSALIGVATITGLQVTGVKLNKTYCVVASELSKAVGGSGGGCSGSSSSASSGSSSNNSDGSSTNSGNSSKDTSSDVSDSSSSSPGPVKYDATNSYSIRDELWADDGQRTVHMLLDSAAVFGITGITGLHDKYGNDIKTPSQLASMFGIEKQYDDYANAMNVFNKNPTPKNRTAELNAKSSMFNAGDSYYQLHQNYKTPYSPQVFLHNPSDVSFSGTDAASGKNFTTTYTEHADNYGYGNRDPSHTKAANFNTGIPLDPGTISLSGTGTKDFQLAFDMPKPK